MGRHSTTAALETVSKTIRDKLYQLNDGRPTAFWRRHLSAVLSQHVFNMALLGRPVPPEVVSSVLDAYDKEVLRLWRMICDDVSPVELKTFVDVKYADR